MLVIRSAQRHLLTRPSTERFTRLVTQDLERYYPDHFAIHGEEQLRGLVLLGIERAAAHGLTSARDTYLYVVVMLTLGASFDHDPLFPWAREMLREAAERDPSRRMGALAEAAVDYYERIAGDDCAIIHRALRRLHHRLRSLVDGPEAAPSFTEDMVARLHLTYARKLTAASPASLRRFVEEGRQAAGRYGLDGARGARAYLIIAFMLGRDFAEDPLHGWARSVLAGTFATEAQKVDRLVDATSAHIARWMGRRS